MLCIQDDATCEATDTARNGFHEQKPETQINTIAPRIPMLKQ